MLKSFLHWAEICFLSVTLLIDLDQPSGVVRISQFHLCSWQPFSHCETAVTAPRSLIFRLNSLSSFKHPSQVSDAGPLPPLTTILRPCVKAPLEENEMQRSIWPRQVYGSLELGIAFLPLRPNHSTILGFFSFRIPLAQVVLLVSRYLKSVII